MNKYTFWLLFWVVVFLFIYLEDKNMRHHQEIVDCQEKSSSDRVVYCGWF